jgi:hypothetical protein
MKVYGTLVLVLFSVLANAQGGKKLTYGETKNGIYTNKYFGLKLKFSKEWFVKSREELEQLTNQGKDPIKAKNSDLGDLIDMTDKTTAYLFGMSKYEAGAAVKYNPSFILMAESLKDAPGVRTGETYLYHTKNLLEQTGMAFTFKEGYDELNGFAVLTSKLDYMGLTIHQLYFTKIINGFAVSCILSFMEEEQKAEMLEVVKSIVTG